MPKNSNSPLPTHWTPPPTAAAAAAAAAAWLGGRSVGAWDACDGTDTGGVASGTADDVDARLVAGVAGAVGTAGTAGAAGAGFGAAAAGAGFGAAGAGAGFGAAGAGAGFGAAGAAAGFGAVATVVGDAVDAGAVFAEFSASKATCAAFTAASRASSSLGAFEKPWEVQCEKNGKMEVIYQPAKGQWWWTVPTNNDQTNLAISKKNERFNTRHTTCAMSRMYLTLETFEFASLNTNRSLYGAGTFPRESHVNSWEVPVHFISRHIKTYLDVPGS